MPVFAGMTDAAFRHLFLKICTAQKTLHQMKSETGCPGQLPKAKAFGLAEPTR